MRFRHTDHTQNNSPALSLLLSLLLLFLYAGVGKLAAEEPTPAREEWPVMPESAPSEQHTEKNLDANLPLLLEEGQELFREAVSERDPQRARELYREALLRFEWIVHEGGIQNGRLLYNIGNIHYRLGQIGKAILYYRRAEYYIPGDPHLRHNLYYLRSLRMDRFNGTFSGRASIMLSSWGTLLPHRQKMLLFAASSAILWSAAALFVLKRRRWMSITLAVSALATVFFLGSLITYDLVWRNNREGVIIVQEVVARRGDGESYESSFQEPLHDGTEFRVLDERSGWYFIQLQEGSTGWIPVSAAELVHPRPGEASL
jgi:tetratricopeptide (TPR) repeat protein